MSTFANSHLQLAISGLIVLNKATKTMAALDAHDLAPVITSERAQRASEVFSIGITEKSQLMVYFSESQE